MAIWAEIKKALNTSLGTDEFVPLNEIMIINALFDGSDESYKWASYQHGFGKVLNDFLHLNSIPLSECRNYNEIANNDLAIADILKSVDASYICSKNDTLQPLILAKGNTEIILSCGLGYKKYKVNDKIKINVGSYGEMEFTVFGVDLYGLNTISCIFYNTNSKLSFNEGGFDYFSSQIRQTLNNHFLNSFPNGIKKAIIPQTFTTMGYTSSNYPSSTNKASQLINRLNDKIWIPSASQMIGIGSKWGQYHVVIDEGEKIQNLNFGKTGYGYVCRSLVLSSIDSYGYGYTWADGTRYWANSGGTNYVFPCFVI